jgi:hypothetical protein
LCSDDEQEREQGGETKMKEPKPVYKRLLMVAIAIYVVGVSLMQADLYFRIGKIEHTLLHASAELGHQDGH